MPRPKSLLSGNIIVDEAKKAHNCQHNTRHRIHRGDKRLKVPKGRSSEHYCVSCAIKFLQADITKLEQLTQELEG